ncbi:GNAT family N-acetyltransferase [Candidatus Dojkabacteria bacterium]|nr:GNAT family N-acetyltransferase [Candidatus Dojkabacteria bacterium]
MNKLEFKGIESIKRGDIFSILKKSYKDLYTIHDPSNKKLYFSSWLNTDSSSFDNPTTIGKFIFTSFLDSQFVGFISFDPRKFPIYGTIGQNCIDPEYKVNGYGKLQLQYLLDYFKDKGVKKALVSTGESSFFLPARRMYESVGFKMIRIDRNITFGGNEIFYEKTLF